MKLEIKEIKLKDGKKTFQRIFGDSTMTFVHTRLHAYCSDYVPMDSGMLDQTVDITPEYVCYRSPYAHYQWAGVVYGPNIPIYKDGVLKGFISPPTKHPTGKKMQYSTDKHPLATSHWEVAAMAAHKGDLCQDITNYLKRK